MTNDELKQAILDKIEELKDNNADMTEALSIVGVVINGE